MLIDIVLALTNQMRIEEAGDVHFLAHGAVTFGEDHHLLARDLVLLDGFGDHTLRGAIRICIGRIPLLLSAESSKESIFEGSRRTVLMPRS